MQEFNCVLAPDFMKLIILLTCLAGLGTTTWGSACGKRTEIEWLDDLPSVMSIDDSCSSSDASPPRKIRSHFVSKLEAFHEGKDFDDFGSLSDESVQKSLAKLNQANGEGEEAEAEAKSDSIFDYEQYKDGPFQTGLIFAVVLLLFFVMYVVSSDYLTPALAHLSAACKMSPDMAGLTFLAFGNGAPDLFTALSGAQEAPGMILSSSIGSGLFIFTVVFGLVICFAREGSLPASGVVQFVPSGAPLVKIGRGTFWRNVLMYGACVVVLGVFVVRKEIQFWQACGLVVCFAAYLLLSVAIHYLRRKAKKPAAGKAAAEDGEQDESMLLLEIERVRFKLRQKSLAARLVSLLACVAGWKEMDTLSRVAWILTVPVRFLLCCSIMPLPDPTLLSEPEKFVAHSQLLRFLIPVNPLASIPLMAWMTGSWAALQQRFGLGVACALLAVLSFFFAGLLHVSINSIAFSATFQNSKFTEKLPLYAVSVYSFACCIGWIFVASNELVAAILALGPRLGVSSTILGSLMLAWGNSIGDLIADLALARNGIPQTAITAIFSGPIQNVLLTLGISFMYAAASGTLRFPELKKDVIFGLAVLGSVLLVSMVMIPGYFAFRIPRWFGMLLIAIYSIYVPISIYLSL
jgi:sodium/potassium/calcium exchanger 6